MHSVEDKCDGSTCTSKSTADFIPTELDNALKNVEHTGTTIFSINLRDYIVVAVDSRLSTYENGNLKVHDVGEKLWGLHTPLIATGAGFMRHCGKAIQLFEEEIQQGSFSSLKQAANRLKDIVRNIKLVTPNKEGSVAQMILSGFDEYQKPKLFAISSVESHEFIVDRNFIAGGSGSIYANSVLEKGYNATMSVEDAVELARKALHWAVVNDIHTGGSVSICLLSPWDSMVAWKGDIMAYYKPGYTLADFRYTQCDSAVEDKAEPMDVDDC